MFNLYQGSRNETVHYGEKYDFEYKGRGEETTTMVTSTKKAEP